MGDMGDPPKSKRRFYLVGLGVLFLCGGLSGTGAKGSLELESLLGEREREKVAFSCCRHACMLAVGSDLRETDRTLCLNSPACPPKP